MKPMTTNEKNFAADNHDTLLRCLRRKHLPFSEFYDILVMGYIRAAGYSDREIARKFQTTLAAVSQAFDLIRSCTSEYCAD